MCFKEFVEETRGLRLVDIGHETALYRRLVREFNELKQIFIDLEETEKQRQVRLLMMAERRCRFHECVAFDPDKRSAAATPPERESLPTIADLRPADPRGLRFEAIVLTHN